MEYHGMTISLSWNDIISWRNSVWTSVMFRDAPRYSVIFRGISWNVESHGISWSWTGPTYPWRLQLMQAHPHTRPYTRSRGRAASLSALAWPPWCRGGKKRVDDGFRKKWRDGCVKKRRGGGGRRSSRVVVVRNALRYSWTSPLDSGDVSTSKSAGRRQLGRSGRQLPARLAKARLHRSRQAGPAGGPAAEPNGRAEAMRKARWSNPCARPGGRVVDLPGRGPAGLAAHLV
jgi:hypothetical protein